MSSFPQLSYVCSLPWSQLQGTERDRFCEKCGHRVTNLSALNCAERDAFLANSGGERLCVSFYRRASGEFVSAESPLTVAEKSRVRQFGVAVLSASALALAAGCVSKPSPTSANPVGAETPIASASGEETIVLQAFGIVAVPNANAR